MHLSNLTDSQGGTYTPVNWACAIPPTNSAEDPNRGVFVAVIGHVLVPVAVMNAVALGAGYGVARAAGLGAAQRRAVAIEVGIQNSGLALLLIFDLFGALGGMAAVAAWWGIWHIVTGLGLAAAFRASPLRDSPSS